MLNNEYMVFPENFLNKLAMICPDFKRFVSCITLASAITTSCFCQDRQHRLTIQPSVGILFSSLRDARSPFGVHASNFETSTISSETYGARIAYRLSKRFSLVSGYDFVTIKSRTTYAGDLDYLFAANFNAYTIATIDINNSYHQIPLFVRVHFGKGRVSFFLDAGIYASSLNSEYMSRDLKGFLSDGSLAFEGMTIKKDHGRTNKNDWGTAFGLGMSYALSDRFSILLNPQVTLGFQKIDGVYTNESLIYPRTVGFYRVVNDYFSLNSNATYFTISVNGGLSYKLL